jgi:hypothetical protein
VQTSPLDRIQQRRAVLLSVLNGHRPPRGPRLPLRGKLASADERFRTFSRFGAHLCFGDDALVRSLVRIAAAPHDRIVANAEAGQQRPLLTNALVRTSGRKSCRVRPRN